VIKKILFIISLFFAWFLFTFYTLDYSSGEPMMSNLSFFLFPAIFIFAIVYLIKAFKSRHKKTPKG
jgi:hypothetical protein